MLPTALQLHNLLEKLPPTLRTLELPDIQPLDEWHDLSPIAFTNLDRLATYGRPSLLPAILALVRIPSTTRLEIGCNFEGTEERSRRTRYAIVIAAAACLCSPQGQLQPRRLIIVAPPSYTNFSDYTSHLHGIGHSDFHICALNPLDEPPISPYHTLHASRTISPPPLFQINVIRAHPYGPFHPESFFLFNQHDPFTGCSLAQLTALHICSNNPSWERGEGTELVVLPDSFWDMVADLPCLELLQMTATNVGPFVERLQHYNISLEAMIAQDEQQPSASGGAGDSPSTSDSNPSRRFTNLKRLLLTLASGLSGVEVLLCNCALRRELDEEGGWERIELASCQLERLDDLLSKIRELRLNGVFFIS